MGQSAREKASKDISRQYQDIANQAGNDKGFDIFNNYKPEFGYNEMTASADNLFNQQANNLQRLTRTNVADSANRSAQSLASRGITGGSVVDDARARIEGNLYNKEYNALQDLNSQRAGQNLGIMSQANANNFAGKQAQLNALLAKYGIKTGALQGQTANLGGYSDDTWFDDVLGVANTAAGFISPIHLGGGGKSKP